MTIVVVALCLALLLAIALHESQWWHRRGCSLCRGKHEREQKLRARGWRIG